MGFVIKAISSIIDAVADVVKVVWDKIAEPLLEQVFALIGIVDETVVTTQKISTPIFSSYGGDSVHDALVKIVITKIRNNTDFFPTYMQEMFLTKGRVRSYYNYADRGNYTYGLPSMVMSGVTISDSQLSVIDNAIETDIGRQVDILDRHSGNITKIQHFQNILQHTHSYIAHTGTLTHIDSNNVSYDDWTISGEPVFNPITLEYDLSLVRRAPTVPLWIVGPSVATVSDTAVFTVKSGLDVPVDRNLPITISVLYRHIDGTEDYSLDYITIDSGSNYKDVSIVLADETVSEVVVTIENFDNYGGVFQNVNITSDDSYVCNVTVPPDDESYLGVDKYSSDSITYPVVDTTIRSVVSDNTYVQERYFIVQYHLTGTPSSEYHYWYYRFDDNTYDIEVQSERLEQLEMLPVVVLRRDSTFVNSDKDSELYKTTKRLMEFLSFDLDVFIDNIASSPGTDLNSITDAYVNFAIVPSNYDSVMSKLLYRSWYSIVVTNGLYSQIKEYSAVFTEGDINTSIVWTDHIYSKDLTGNITTIGKHSHSAVKTSAGSTLSIFHQTGENTYDRIQVLNINTLSSIEKGGYHEVASSPLWNDDTNGIDENFTMALSWAIFAELTGQEQTHVYKYICRMDLYSLTVTELEWYQTSDFSSLFNIVLTVLAVVSFGKTLILQGILTAAVDLLISYSIGELITFVAEATGSATLAAIVGFIAGVTAKGGNLSNFFDVVESIDVIDRVTAFADNFIKAESYLQNKSLQDLIDEGLEIDEAREQFEKDEELRQKSQYESPISIDFLESLKSLEANIVTAIDSQYQFDDTFGYGKVNNYHSTLLRTEII